MVFLSVALIGYLLGSIPAGYLAGRLAGVDIRSMGSGNIGATNAMRVLGKRYGIPVFIIDFAKGVAAVGISTLVAKRWSGAPNWNQFLAITGGVCCVLGHNYPVWLGFKGGKGVATSAGVLMGLTPITVLIAFVVWFVTLKLTRYVSVASIVAALALPITIGIRISLKQMDGRLLLYFSICIAVVIVLRHRSNLQRLMQGTEPRSGRPT